MLVLYATVREIAKNTLDTPDSADTPAQALTTKYVMECLGRPKNGKTRLNR